MSPVEALHELRRMAQPTCWRCEGSGIVRIVRDYGTPGVGAAARHERCPSCAGTGQPERAAC